LPAGTNKKLFLILILVVLNVATLFASSSLAAINRQMNYQGKITDTDDVAVADGDYDIVFKIYDALTGFGF
jgi:hypothetical protein